MVLLAMIVTLAACRITDQREDEVNTGHLNPATSLAQDTSELPRFEFDSLTRSFGTISQGSLVERQYHFTNAGRTDLVIANVRGSCGCTVGKDWPRNPVRPGEGGTITVSFDSGGREGRQEKTISVIANTRPPTTVLFLHGDVVAPSSSPAPQAIP